MDRKEFLERMGIAITIPFCLGAMQSCNQSNPIPAPTNVDFTIDVSSGALSQNGGYVAKSGLIVARTLSGEFLAVSAACTHEGTSVQYRASQNNFICPSHGATFSSNGKVTNGPAKKSLAVYNTQLTGTTLRVFS
jgi:cytochrome b6-f complex iron-sulfur subunit